MKFFLQSVCVKTILLYILGCASFYAEDNEDVENFSLLLTPEEEQEINQILNKIDNKGAPLANKKCFHLEGILFFNAKNWRIWLNEQMYTQDIEPKDIKILKTSPDVVVLKDQKSQIEFSLSTNQTFCLPD